MTAARQVAERVTRGRENAARRSQAANEQEAREIRSRLKGERQAARTELGNVRRNDWWGQASSAQIAHTYESARAWTGEDPEAAPAEHRIRDEVHTRFGIEIRSAGGDPTAVPQAVDRAEELPRQVDAESRAAQRERAEAQKLLTKADRSDRNAAELRTVEGNELEDGNETNLGTVPTRLKP